MVQNTVHSRDFGRSKLTTYNSPNGRCKITSHRWSIGSLSIWTVKVCKFGLFKLRHLDQGAFLTVGRARELTFWEKVPLSSLTCVMCIVSCVTCHFFVLFFYFFRLSGEARELPQKMHLSFGFLLKTVRPNLWILDLLGQFFVHMYVC